MDNQVVEEISLRELIEILLKRKKLIAAITLGAIFLAGIYSFLIAKPIYEVEMVLMASNLSDRTDNLIDTGKVESMLDSVAKYPSMNLETYKQQILTPEVINKTIMDLGLEGELNVETFVNKIKIETVNDTQLIKIKRSSDNAQRAAEIVNKIGENFIEVVSENIGNRTSSSSEYVKEQMEIEKDYYEKALLEQKELLSQPRGASELTLELSALLDQVTEYKSNLNDFGVRKEALLASIEVSQEIPSQGSSIVINRESGNILIDDSTKTLSIELAEVEASIGATEKSIEGLKDKIEELQLELQDKRYKEDLVNQKVDIARNTYEAFMRKYEELRVTESAKIGEASITVVSRAFPTSIPVGPNKKLNLAISLVLGLMVGVFAAFFIEYWKSSEVEVAEEEVNS